MVVSEDEVFGTRVRNHFANEYGGFFLKVRKKRKGNTKKDACRLVVARRKHQRVSKQLESLARMSKYPAFPYLNEYQWPESSHRSVIADLYTPSHEHSRSKLCHTRKGKLAPSSTRHQTLLTTMSTNGESNPIRRIALRPGVYAPILTIFRGDSEDLDIESQTKHAVRLAETGLSGLVVHGSNGEAVHLSASERTEVISSIRAALDAKGFSQLPLIAGCSAQGVRTAVDLCREACQAGASYAIVLPPCYYRPAMTAETIKRFYGDVADESSLPVLVYNYPGAAAGVDMDSDTLLAIAGHRNVVGAKLTCANTGKLTRLADVAGAMTPGDEGSGFLATGGLADMVVQSYVSGGSGVIAGTANVFPRFCVRVWELCEKGEMGEARRLQKMLAKADWVLTKGGVGGTKAALRKYFGYGGVPRRPLTDTEPRESDEMWRSLQEAFEVEMSL